MLVNGQMITILVTLLSLLDVLYAASRTSPPTGSLVVRAGTVNPGEFATLTSALNSITNDSSDVSIFIYPGTYNEQVDITRSGPLTIYGYTTDTTTYSGNRATLSAGVSLNNASSDDATGTLRIHKNDFRMYNVNVKNTFGVGVQAIAISQYGSRVGLYACGFFGYQDTLYANQGTQVYLKGYIEGAVDFIFGRQGQAYFGGNTIAIAGEGHVTASGRQSNDNGSYVFNENTIVLAPDAFSNATGTSYLGRPWSDYAKVIFKNTVVNVPLNPEVWSVWNPGTPNTDHVLFADYNSTGPGIGTTRASFATILNATQAAAYSISSAVGSDYTSWVDMDYFV